MKLLDQRKHVRKNNNLSSERKEVQSYDNATNAANTPNYFFNYSEKLAFHFPVDLRRPVYAYSRNPGCSFNSYSCAEGVISQEVGYTTIVNLWGNR